MPARTRSDADPSPTGDTPPPADPPASVAAPTTPPLRPVAEASDPDVHRLVFERQAAETSPVDQAAVDRINAELAELGFA